MTEIPSGSVIVTPDDMWRVMQETRDDVRDLKALLDPSLADIRQDIRDLDEREQKHHDQHEGKIRALEQASWSSRWVPALISSVLVSVVAGTAVYVITTIR